MRFMVIVKATKDTEAGVMPSEQLLRDMGKFNEELVKAGVMQAGEGLQPSSKGARVRFSGDKRTRHRRAVRRNQGAGRRLLDLEVQVAAGGDRVGQAVPESDAGRIGDRDSPGVRGRGFRRRVHAGAARAGRARVGRSGQEREEVTK